MCDRRADRLLWLKVPHQIERTLRTEPLMLPE